LPKPIYSNTHKGGGTREQENRKELGVFLDSPRGTQKIEKNTKTYKKGE
jgi:hypothetical protein